MKSRSETLVILTPAFPANESETSWVTTQQLFVKALRDAFPLLKIILLSLYYPGHSTPYEWKGLSVIPFNAMQYRKVRRFLLWNKIRRRLRTIRRNNNVIGFFSFWCGESALIGSYSGKWYGLPHYCWLCGQDARAQNTLVKWIRPKPEELIAMSDFLVHEFYHNHGIRPRHMIPNGIDPGMFLFPPSPERDIDVLGAGSLSALKQYDVFITIVDSLRRSFPGIRSILCGDGEDREDLRELSEQLGLEDNLTLMGLTPHREVLELMQRTRVFLHTSNYEGFGVVCLEALYAGAQVISFCQPMEQPIPRWHIVNDAAEMLAKAQELLADTHAVYEPLLPYTMDNTVRAVMKLFKSKTMPYAE